MRVNPLCIAVLAIAETAVILGAQELPANDAARQDHARVEREDIRYPKRVKVLKKRNYHGRPSDEVHLNSDDIIRLQMVGDKVKHVPRNRKFLTTSEGYYEAVSLRPEENVNAEKQEDNEKSCCGGVTALKCDVQGMAVTLAESIGKNDHDVKSKSNQPHKVYTQHLHPKLSKPVDGASLGSATECPTNVENMFVCGKCRTHYAVRVNIVESKCDKECAKAREKRSVDKNSQIWDDFRGKREPPAEAPPQSCGECPNSLETMFQCPKCFTWYSIRINFKESKCGTEGAAPGATTGSEGGKFGTHDPDESRDKRENSRTLIRVKPCSDEGMCTTPPPATTVPTCLNSIEQMFKCNKCKTHYIVKINLKESKCAGAAGPASSSKLARMEDQDLGIEENGFRKKVPRPSYQRKFRKQPLPSLHQI